jgi:integrase
MPYLNKQKETMKAYPWMGQVRVNKERRRKLHKTKREAQEWEAQTRYEMENPPDSSLTTHSVSVLEWATKYLRYSEKKYVVKTFQEKRKAFKELLQNEEIDPQSSVDLIEVATLIDHLMNQAEDRSGNASNKDRKNLMAAWKWGIKSLKMPRPNPFLEVERLAENRHERHMPPLKDVLKVIDHTETEQDRLMLWLYLQTGARREELFRLKWKDVDLQEHRVRLWWRKNNLGEWKGQWVPVKEDTSASLKEHRKKAGFKEFVFLNMQGSAKPEFWIPYRTRQHFLKNLCVKAGVQKFGFHGIRHLFASILAEKNVPLVEIQFMLRHSHLTTTQRYIRRIKTESREVVKALPGMNGDTMPYDFASHSGS